MPASNAAPECAPDPSAAKWTRDLVRILDRLGVTILLDVGANTGQYGRRLRGAGYRGRLVSFEPAAEAHAALLAAAAEDPGWQVAPPIALGDRDGQVTINISAESDMSSALDFRPEMADLLDSARYVRTETVPIARLDRIFDRWVAAGDRPFLKSDTQGCDLAVLDGAAGILDRLAGIQLELALRPVYEGEPTWLEAIARLDRLGFEPALFIPGYFNRRTARLLSMDGVFVRRDG